MNSSHLCRRRLGMILSKILIPLGVVVGILAYIGIAGSTGFCPTCTAIVSAVTGKQQDIQVASLAQPGAVTTNGAVHELVMTDLSGESIELSRFAGRPMVLDIWATWCGPCRKLRSSLHAVAEESKQYGAIVSVSLDQGGRKVVEEYIRTKEGGVSPFVELVNTDPRLSKVLKPFDRKPTIPKLVFVDANGNIVDIEYGVVDPKWVVNRLRALSSASSRG